MEHLNKNKILFLIVCLPIISYGQQLSESWEILEFKKDVNLVLSISIKNISNIPIILDKCLNPNVIIDNKFTIQVFIFDDENSLNKKYPIIKTSSIAYESNSIDNDCKYKLGSNEVYNYDINLADFYNFKEIKELVKKNSYNLGLIVRVRYLIPNEEKAINKTFDNILLFIDENQFHISKISYN